MDEREAHLASDGWLRDLRRRVAEATENRMRFIGRYALGPLAFSLWGNSHKRLERMSSFLLPTAAAGTADELRIDVVHGETAAGPTPHWNLPHSNPRHLERLHISTDLTLAAQYNEDQRSWLVLDLSQNRGLLWIDDLDQLPAWDVVAPFRTMFHWYLASTPLAIVHAGALEHGETAVLLAGPGGAGKSTTVAIASTQGMKVFGDDLVIVGEHQGTSQVFALYDAIKLDPAAPIPKSLGIIAETGWPCADKVAYHYRDLGSDRLGRQAPLSAIAHCVVAGRPETTALPTTQPQVLKALAPSTLFLLRGFEQATLAKISAIVRTLPSVELQLGSEPQGVAQVLRQIG